MNNNSNKSIWTVGHSNKSFEEFLLLVKKFNIDTIIDVRHFPGSRKFPYFNKESLIKSLPKNSINYIHLESLGGRRKVKPNSKNTAWRNVSFQGYADYMETENFDQGILQLEEIALGTRTAFMCSEAVWWRCHRSMISDYLKINGWKVLHIMSLNQEVEHPYTTPAKNLDGKLSYSHGTSCK